MDSLPDDLNDQMLKDALIIVASVGFMERRINSKFGELEEAINNGFYDDVEPLKQQISGLIKRIGEENRHMDLFMVKYKNLINNEKEAILSGVK